MRAVLRLSLLAATLGACQDDGAAAPEPDAATLAPDAAGPSSDARRGDPEVDLGAAPDAGAPWPDARALADAVLPSSDSDSPLRDAAGLPDAGWAPPVVDYPTAESPRVFLLSETGLYREMATKTLAPDLVAFEPRYALWSDAAEKRRWVRLPAGGALDATVADAWQLPVGAQMFKEFSKGGRRLETRVIARTGPGPRDYFMGAFLWDEAESDARFVPEGARDVLGTGHDVPEARVCGTCHNGEPGRLLGFSSIQATPALLSDLRERGWLPAGLPERAGAGAPGEGDVAEALGYLHANCGHCHNARGSAWPDTDMVLRLSLAEARPEETAIYATTIGQPLVSYLPERGGVRVAPGDPLASAVRARMALRGREQQMPPLATEEVHAEGLALITRWIEGL